MEYERRILVALSADEHRRLAKAAAEKGTSMSAVVRAGICLMTGSTRGAKPGPAQPSQAERPA
jgi:hypothetical protein